MLLGDRWPEIFELMLENPEGTIMLMGHFWGGSYLLDLGADPSTFE